MAKIKTVIRNYEVCTFKKYLDIKSRNHQNQSGSLCKTSKIPPLLLVTA